MPRSFVYIPGLARNALVRNPARNWADMKNKVQAAFGWVEKNGNGSGLASLGGSDPWQGWSTSARP
jgi:hypothetical protein